MRMNTAGCVMTAWASVAAERLLDHDGLKMQPIQSVFNEHLYGYHPEEASGMARDSLTMAASETANNRPENTMTTDPPFVFEGAGPRLLLRATT